MTPHVILLAMADNGNGFWQQYQENLREHNRQAPWRFLRLIVAFGITLVLAPCCMVVANVTGEPMAAMAVALVGIVTALVVWKVLWWVFDRPAPLAPLNMSPHHHPYPAPGFVTAQAVADPIAKPIMSASAGPVPPFAAEPPRSGVSGCVITMLAIGGVSLLLCCGGGAAVMAFIPHLKLQARPNAVRLVPPPMAFGPGGGNPFPAGNAFPGGDPFADMNRQQQQHIDEVFRQQRDMMRQQEEQMREFQRQIDQQNNQLFQPDF